MVAYLQNSLEMSDLPDVVLESSPLLPSPKTFFSKMELKNSEEIKWNEGKGKGKNKIIIRCL